MEMVNGDRQWKLREEVRKEIQNSTQEQATLGLSPLTLKACLARGLRSPEAIQEFLFPRLENLTPPTRICDMDRAVERLARIRQPNNQPSSQKEKLRIFGDYDVDGTTGAALLTWVFREFGFECDAKQPDRFKDGYGLNVRAVEEAAEEGVRVLVTVDCGITSFDAAQRAKSLGIDLIVVDHHQIDPTRGLPPAYAVIDPQRADCESGLKQVCGCGLAFYLAIALRSRGRQEGWFAGEGPNLKQHLDLVVMATAADMVPLVGDNHILVRYGLEVLRRSKKPGVKALLEVSGLSAKTLSPGSLGFVLGPRINASGRIQSAGLALELLTTMDADRALVLAQELERLNQERTQIQNKIWDEVRVRVEQGINEGKYRHGIALASDGWHEGVVGIVASRVTETFRKPAAVIAIREDFGKGSVRSYGGRDVLAALRTCAQHLKAFGGHKHAAGLSVEIHQIHVFAEAFDLACEGLPEEADAGVLQIEGMCSIEELDVKTLEELERLGPFGPGNPEPVFALRAQVRNQRILKERHLKLRLGASADGARDTESETHPEIQVDAIWFYGAERQDVRELSTLIDEDREWAGVPELNRFAGRVTPTFRVKDWRAVGTALVLLVMSVLGVSGMASGLDSTPSSESTSAIGAVDLKVHFKEFLRAQNTELKAMEHRHKMELKELKIAHKSKLREWEKEERDARHRFFAQHEKGPDRRSYVQDFLKRREELHHKQNEERTKRTKELDAQMTALKLEHEVKLKEFQKVIRSGAVPPAELWPVSGQ